MWMYFPNGTGTFWFPPTPGMGSAWQISPILEPLLPFKKKMLVLGSIGNWSAYGNAFADPSHGTNCGPAFHGFESRMSKGLTDAAPGGGISVDQVIAQQIEKATPLASLPIGLSTIDSNCDGSPCAHSRSMSWAGPNKPLYKVVNPQAVFDTLVMAGAPKAGMTLGPTMPMASTPDPKLEQMRLLKKSVLDAVLDSAKTLQPKLSVSDRVRVDQYLTSVADLEKLIAAPAMQLSPGMGGPTVACSGMPRPGQPVADNNVPPGYSRETHMDLMIQLITMAFACDLTRVITFMMDDSRSEFGYGHVPKRNFINPAGGMMTPPYVLSSLKGGVCGNYHGAQHGDNEEFSTITWWMALKASKMAQALDAIKEGTGTVLDNTVIHFGSGMSGGNHDGRKLPTVLIGSGGGVLKQDGYVDLANGDAPGGGSRLANLHLTLIQKVFGSPATTFGNLTAPATTGILPGILA
jgi:Protein of unknown function (DUF1552)